MRREISPSDEPGAYKATCCVCSLRYGMPVHAPWAQAEWRAQCQGRWQWHTSIESPHTGERQSPQGQPGAGVRLFERTV